ncbi:MAG: CBS domain-containing protein [Candidatus Altiarchaeota archaeon]
MILVKDYMTPSPVCVKTDDLLSKARSIIRKHGYRALPVLDSKSGMLVGIISRSDILRVTSNRTNLQVSGLMKANVITASPDDNLLNVSKVFVKYGIRQVPVVDSSKKLTGILSALDILNAFIGNKITPVRKKVREVMSTEVVSCSPDENLTKVWEKMLSTGYSGLPVLDGKKVVGIITRMDLLKHGSAMPNKESGKDKHVPVRKLMQSHVVTVYPSEETQKVAEIMTKEKIIRVPVVETGMKLAGIADIEDILRAYTS